MEYRQEMIHFSNRLPGKIFLHRLGSVSRHWHHSLELLFVCEGEVTVTVDNIPHTLHDSDILLINSLSVHELNSSGAVMVAVQIDLSAMEQFENYRDCYFDCCSEGRTSDARYDFLRHLISRLVKENTPHENQLISLALFSLMVNELVDNFRTEAPENIAARIKLVGQMAVIAKYINEHYAENLSLGAIAEQFHFSESHLSRMFRQAAGVNFSQYYSDVRLDRAVGDLLSGKQSISDIAVGNGFPDARSFTAAFRRRYGMLPSEYRSTYSGRFEQMSVSKNEVNYLSVESSTALSSLGKYLRADAVQEFIPEQANVSRLPDCSASSAVQGRKLQHTWRTLCTVGSTLDLLDEDVRDMLRRLQTEVGFRYVKFHGLLSDDLMLYSEDSEGRPQLSFVYFDKVMDFLAELGLRPLMQFCFMPRALASDPSKVQFYSKQNTSLPKNIENWRYLVENVVRHCMRRYGADEVRTWIFSFWNEPDTTTEMFGFEDRRAFFDVYRETWRTVKGIDPGFRFGTPGLLMIPDDPLGWYRDFFAYCIENDCRPDFLNLHYYMDDLELREWGNKNTSKVISRLSEDPNDMAHYLDTCDESLQRYSFGGLPVCMTEWNMTVSHRNLLNDTCFKSCYIVYNILSNYDRIQSFGYWFLTDRARELQLPDMLYHGGLGLFTVNGIPKANYNAFLLLRGLEDICLASGNGWMVTANPSRTAFAAIFCCYEHYDGMFSSGELFDMTGTQRYTVFTGKKRSVSLKITDVPDGTYAVTESFVNQNCGSSYDAWVTMGAQEEMSGEDLEFLRSTSRPGRKLSRMTAESGCLSLERTLEPLEVRLIRFVRSDPA